MLLWPIFAALILAISGLAQTQGQTNAPVPSAVRDFTTKEGETWTARIVALSPAGQQLILRSADMRQHSLATVELCLEDQLFVRDWDEAQRGSSAVANRSVELRVEELVETFERRRFQHGDHTITHEEMREGFRLKVHQSKSESTMALRAEYFLLYWDKVSVYPVAGGKRTDWSSYSGKGRILYCYDEIRFPVERDKGEQEKTTATVKIDRLEGETEADRIGHDQLAGIRVRLVDPLGNLVADFSNLPAGFSKLDWVALHAARQANDTDYEKVGAMSRAARGMLQVNHANYAAD